MTKNKNRHVTKNFLGPAIILGLNIHQFFYLLHKKIKKKYEEIFLSAEWIIMKSRRINIAPEHCFDVTLADFEQIINNDFIQLEAEWLNDIKVNESRYKQCGVTPQFSTGQILLKKILNKYRKNYWKNIEKR